MRSDKIRTTGTTDISIILKYGVEVFRDIYTFFFLSRLVLVPPPRRSPPSRPGFLPSDPEEATWVLATLGISVVPDIVFVDAQQLVSIIKVIVKNGEGRIVRDKNKGRQ